MTTLEKIKRIVQTANTEQAIVLHDSMVEEIMPKVIDAINNQCKDIGYDGVTYNRHQSEYPEAFYKVLYLNTIRQTVLDYLEENHPMAWFKPMYFTIDEQNKLFNRK